MFAYLAHAALGVQPCAVHSPSAGLGFLPARKGGVHLGPKFFEGCSKVFLDIGSNRGTHVRKLFEPEKYPGCPYLPLFDQAFGTSRSGPSSETGICAFGFEANPRWASTLQEIEKAYAAKGWRAKFFVPAAVGNAAGDCTYWLNDKDGQHSDWGFSSIKTNDQARPVKVPVVDLSHFMQELTAHAPPGYRLMKMDIEGDEFVVLPKFLDNHFLCKNVLDKLTIEWHDRFLAKDQLPAASKTKLQVESPTKCGGQPSTIVKDFDDESFLNDGMPLPSKGHPMTLCIDVLIFLMIWSCA